MKLKPTNFLLALAIVIATLTASAQTVPDTRVAPGATDDAVSFRHRNDTDSPRRHGLRKSKPNLKGNYVSRHSSVGSSKPRKAVRKAAPTHDLTVYGTAGSGYDGGLYSFSTTQDGIEEVTSDARLSSVNGGCFSNGKYYSFNGFVNNTVNPYKVSVWNFPAIELDREIVDPDLSVEFVTADPVSGIIYSICWIDNNEHFATYNPETFSRIRDYGEVDGDFWYVDALFFDNNGNLWILDDEGGLYSVDKNSFETEYVADTGIDTYWLGRVAVDPASGLAYVFANGEDDSYILYELDLDTYEATQLYEFEDAEDFNTIFIVPEAAAGGAPFRTEDLALSFTDASLSGSITFTAPTETTDGSTGSGSLTYTLSVNGTAGTPVACGWGESVSIAYTAPAAGQYAFTVIFTNDTGDSDPASASTWIGADTPRGVTGLRATCFENEVTLTWQPSAGSINGGYIVPEEVAYRITRLPDNTVVTEALQATTYTDVFPESNNTVEHTYTVEAVWNGNASDPATSNRVLVGATFFNGFDTDDDMNVMTNIASVNGDNRWRRFSDYRYSAAMADKDEDGATSTWMISPKLALTGGRTYTLSFDAWGSHQGSSERISAYITDTDVPAEIYQKPRVVDGETTPVTWEFADKDLFGPLSGKFTPEADGDYYITIVAHSLKDMATEYIDDLTLVKDPVVPMPAAPAVTAVLGDDLDVAVTIVAPSKDTEGNDLPAIEKIVLSRNDVDVKTFESPSPGATLTYEETLPAGGVYTYSAVAYNENGHSAAGSYAVAAVEPSNPVAPLNLTAVETSNPGEVTLTWIAPTRDTNGNPVSAADLTYNIYRVGATQPEATAVSGLTYTFRAVPADADQQFVSFRVAAVNKAGEGAKSLATEPAPFGTPDTLPYKESLSGMTFDNVWHFDAPDDYSDGEWIIISASEQPEATPQDNDGGMLAFFGEMLYDAASITSAKISLAGAANPMLSFWYFGEHNSYGQNEIGIYVNDGTGFKKLEQFSMRDEEKNGWARHTTSLAAYAGKTISIRFEGFYFRTGHFMLIDNITVTDGNAAGIDLEVDDVRVPAEVYAGSKLQADLYVKNNHTEAVTNIPVKFYVDGALITQGTIERIAAGNVGGIRFNLNPDMSWLGTHSVRFEVDYAQDVNTANNVSEDKRFKVNEQLLPTVTRLGADYEEGSATNVVINWAAPDFTQADGTYVETFESYRGFTVNPESEWTFVDADGAITYYPTSLQGLVTTDPKAFIIIDDSNINGTFASKSGNKYIAAFSTQAQSDDWMISPELSGKKQTISFSARAFLLQPGYGDETFEVLASSTGTDLADFTKVKSFTANTTEWTTMSAELPAGTLYFAIRYTGYDAYTTFFDDMRYQAAVHPAKDFEIVGYNIYRNGIRLNEHPLTSLTYTDNPTGTLTPRYSISVVYDRGESPTSIGVGVGESAGIAGVNGSVAAFAVKGGIMVQTEGPADVNAYSVDGKTVFSGSVNGNDFIPASAGVYVVTVGQTSFKLIVD